MLKECGFAKCRLLHPLYNWRFLKEDDAPSVFAWSTSEPKPESPTTRQLPETTSTATTNVDDEAGDLESDDCMEVQREKEKLENENEEPQRSVAELKIQKTLTLTFVFMLVSLISKPFGVAFPERGALGKYCVCHIW